VTLRRDFECVTFTIPPIERNSSHPRIFFADFLLVASAKLAHQKMQSVDNIFEQALPTVIGFPSMPLSSMAMVAIFLSVTLPLNASMINFLNRLIASINHRQISPRCSRGARGRSVAASLQPA
jgi:hypothetical protein